MFGDRIGLVERYAGILETQGVERGLIGPREVDRLWERHLLNSALMLSRVPLGSTVADIGTGAGLPGLVWAITRPDLTVTLVEPLLRRATFLQEVIDALDIQNARVLRARAEEVDETFDVVTARAVAALPKLSKWCMPLVAPRGLFLPLKGQSAAAEVEESRSLLKRLGASAIDIVTYSSSTDPSQSVTLVEISK
ncbi:MAG: 16S rRNA (guanine(527)-N(7))-methyltransferase RsmG [Aeromicrobium sp.]|nr:MAG: 16S rRNA (guanine(527)-N(7))-methyltransferase RsmG [Aeromicrobium sp.]